MRRLFVPDSAFFIESVRGHFPLTEGSRFWQGVADLATHGRLHVIDQVKKEIDREGDELKLWVNEHLAPALVSTNDAGTAQALSDVMRWVYAQRGLYPVAVDLFARSSDAWVVAHALAAGGGVVTYPAPVPAAGYRLDMTFVCRAFEVPVHHPVEVVGLPHEEWALTASIDSVQPARQ